eukprot:3825324-Pleurochrysis_carterae.AAC.2
MYEPFGNIGIRSCLYLLGQVLLAWPHWYGIFLVICGRALAAGRPHHQQMARNRDGRDGDHVLCSMGYLQFLRPNVSDDYSLSRL